MTRWRSRLRKLGAGAAVAAAIAVSPVGSAFADSAGPTDYQTTIQAVVPDVSGAATFSVEGSDAFMRVVVAPGHELVVLGYDGEDYIKVDADGAVFENQNSEAYYYNRERFGGEIPAEADSSAPPKWVEVDRDGEHAWHDHRAHWMAEYPLVGMNPGDAFPPEHIEVVVDGQPVTITVVTTRLRPASRWWLVAGVAAAAPAIAAVAVSGRGAQRRRLLVGAATAAVAVVFGLAEYAAVPASTGPSLTWWAVPVLAAATFAAGAWVGRSARSASLALLIGGGIELVVWAVLRSPGLLAAYRPTVLPAGADRIATTAVGLVGVTLATVGAYETWRLFSPRAVTP